MIYIDICTSLYNITYVNYRSTNYNNNTVLGIVCCFGDLISKHKVRKICHVGNVALPTHTLEHKYNV